MKHDKKTIFANIALFFVALIWGGGFVAGKMSITGTTPFAVLVYRFGAAALLTFIIFFKRIIRCDFSTIKKGVCIGALQAVALGVQLSGLQYTTSAKQAFLCTAYVAMVPFISWILLRKRVTAREVVAGFTALLGIALISLQGSLNIGLGDGLSLIFALLFGIQIVLIGKFMDDKTDIFAFSFFQFLSAFILALSVCLIRGESLVIGGTEALIGVGYLILFNTVLAFIAQNIAQRYTTDTMASLLLSLESLFGFAFSILYYRETPDFKFFAGAFLCFIAILINSYKRKKTPDLSDIN